MNDNEKAKITRFLNDEVMSGAVYKALQNAFLEPYTIKTDVMLLAASRIALDMLPEAWKELHKHARQEEALSREDNNHIGL